MKIGLIVEGDCERIILKSDIFRETLRQNNLELVADVVNIGGKGNLKNRKIQSQVEILRSKGTEKIIVLRDLEDLPSIATAKNEVYQAPDIIICIEVKTLESWFLADSETLSTIFKSRFYFEYPETENRPIDKLKFFSLQFTNTGIGDKKIFARKMVKNGFSIQRAAQHPNCPSANYFLNKLQSLNSYLI